jgi:toxin-antitoxin system PIN domain toxin
VSRIALLDVSVLVALFHPDHFHHESAHAWFDANRGGGWATSPLTENGVVRILSNSATMGAHQSAASVRKRLEFFCSSDDHSFWADSISLRDESRFDFTGVSHRQITDVYLLALAVEHGGRLATLDRSIPARAVVNAGPESLEIITA